MRLTLRTGLLLIGLALPAVPLRAEPSERGPKPHLVDLYGDPLPEGAVARLGSVRLRHVGLQDFTLLPNGRTAVTVGRDATVRWWDLATGRQTQSVRLPDESSYPSRLAISPDGKAVAINSWENTWVCEAETGRRVFSQTKVDGFVDALALSPDHSRLAIGVNASELTLITLNSGASRLVKLAEPPRCGHRPFLRARYSADGRRVLVSGTSGHQPRVALLDAADGKEAFSAPVYGISATVSPDGSRVAVCTHKDEDSRDELVVRLFDVRHREGGRFVPAGCR